MKHHLTEIHEHNFNIHNIVLSSYIISLNVAMENIAHDFWDIVSRRFTSFRYQSQTEFECFARSLNTLLNQFPKEEWLVELNEEGFKLGLKHLKVMEVMQVTVGQMDGSVYVRTRIRTYVCILYVCVCVCMYTVCLYVCL